MTVGEHSIGRLFVRIDLDRAPGALLGSIAGVMLVDYFIIRRLRLDTDDLYRTDGQYAFGGSGFNWRALVAMAAGILPNVPGFLAQASGGSISVAPIFDALYPYAWFVSLLLAGFVHWGLTWAFPPVGIRGSEPSRFA